MKRLLIVFLGFLMTTQAWAISNQKMNGETLIEQAKLTVETEDFSNFFEQLSNKNFANTQFTITEYNFGSHSITDGRNRINFHAADNGIRINGKFVKINAHDTTEEIFNKFKKALNIKNHASNNYGVINMIHSLIFPQAEAALPLLFGVFPAAFYIPVIGMGIAAAESHKKCKAYFAQNRWVYDGGAQQGTRQYEIQRSHCTRSNPPYRIFAKQMDAEARAQREARDANSRRGEDRDTYKTVSYTQPTATYSTRNSTQSTAKKCWWIFCGHQRSTTRTATNTQDLAQPVAL